MIQINPLARKNINVPNITQRVFGPPGIGHLFNEHTNYRYTKLQLHLLICLVAVHHSSVALVASDVQVELIHNRPS
jgi:hypothetical protein